MKDGHWKLAAGTAHIARKNLAELLRISRELDLKVKAIDVMQSGRKSAMREIFMKTLQREIDIGTEKEKALRETAEQYIGQLQRAEEREAIRLRYILGMSNEEIRASIFPNTRRTEAGKDCRLDGVMRSALDKLDYWEEMRRRQ